MRAREFLSESSGMYNRKVGDEYRNSQTGKVVSFQSIVSYPNSGKYSSLAERQKVQASIEGKKLVQWVNPTMESNPNYLAFSIVEVCDSDGNCEYWGRYFKEIVGNMLRTWDNKEVPSGWKLQIKSAQKSAAGYDPQHLIRVETPFSNVKSVLDAVSNQLGIDHELSRGLVELSQGQLPIFKGMAGQMPAIRDYFGEIMAPIALIAGSVSGDADLARVKLLGSSGSWGDCAIWWPMGMNHNLVDSYLRPPSNFDIGISSKGGVGARASVKNIYDQLVQVQKRAENSDELAAMLDQYKLELDLITKIQTQSQLLGPISLAVDLKVLTLDQSKQFANEVQSLIKNPNQRPSELLTSFMALKGARSSEGGYNPGYHALAGLAEQVAAELNSMPTINQFIKKLLNDSNMLQIYTKMAVKGNDAVVTGFNAIFPAQFDGNVEIYANKGYSSTGIKQKFVFGFV